MAISNLFSGLGGNYGTTGNGTSGQLASAMQTQTAQSDQNQTELISAQMDSEKQKTSAQIHQIQEETKTKVAEMFRETNLNRSKSATKLHSKWVQQIMA